MHALHKLVKHNFIRVLPLHKFEKDHVSSACVRDKQVRVYFKLLKSVSPQGAWNYCIWTVWTSPH